MLFVDYDDLCSQPIVEVNRIYKFLGLDPCGQHNAENVEQKVSEQDEFYGWKNLHLIRPIIQKQESQAVKYLPLSVISAYEKNAKFWRML